MGTVLGAGERKAFPNVVNWFERCISLPSFIRRMGYVKMTEKAFRPFDKNAKVEPVKATPVKKDVEEDDEAAKKAAEAAKASKKKVKKPVIAMSLVMLEVKPFDDQTNLDDLAQRLYKNITQEGLFWKTEYKKEPVAFGIFKLIVGFSLEDEKVSVDDVVEKIEEITSMVQSVEIAVFNKI